MSEMGKEGQFIFNNADEIRASAKVGVKEAITEKQRGRWREVFLRAGEIKTALRGLLK